MTKSRKLPLMLLTCLSGLSWGSSNGNSSPLTNKAPIGLSSVYVRLLSSESQENMSIFLAILNLCSIQHEGSVLQADGAPKIAQILSGTNPIQTSIEAIKRDAVMNDHRSYQQISIIGNIKSYLTAYYKSDHPYFYANGYILPTQKLIEESVESPYMLIGCDISDLDKVIGDITDQFSQQMTVRYSPLLQNILNPRPKSTDITNLIRQFESLRMTLKSAKDKYEEYAALLELAQSEYGKVVDSQSIGSANLQRFNDLLRRLQDHLDKSDAVKADLKDIFNILTSLTATKYTLHSNITAARFVLFLERREDALHIAVLPLANFTQSNNKNAPDISLADILGQFTFTTPQLNADGSKYEVTYSINASEPQLQGDASSSRLELHRSQSLPLPGSRGLDRPATPRTTPSIGSLGADTQSASSLSQEQPLTGSPSSASSSGSSQGSSQIRSRDPAKATKDVTNLQSPGTRQLPFMPIGNLAKAAGVLG